MAESGNWTPDAKSRIVLVAAGCRLNSHLS